MIENTCYERQVARELHQEAVTRAYEILRRTGDIGCVFRDRELTATFKFYLRSIRGEHELAQQYRRDTINELIYNSAMFRLLMHSLPRSFVQEMISPPIQSKMEAVMRAPVPVPRPIGRANADVQPSQT